MADFALKDYQDYPAILDLSHNNDFHGGIKMLEIIKDFEGKPTLIFHTHPDGTETFITAARVTYNDGTVWEDWGDADAKSVRNRNIVPHLLRMAFTRAKGRAMRDAMNKGRALEEEFGPDGGEDVQHTVKPPKPAPEESESELHVQPPKGAFKEYSKKHGNTSPPPSEPYSGADELQDLVQKYAEAEGIDEVAAETAVCAACSIRTPLSHADQELRDRARTWLRTTLARKGK